MAVQVAISTASVLRATPGTKSGPILAANPRRDGVWIKNVGSEAVYLAIGRAATLLDYPLGVGEALYLRAYTGELSGIVEKKSGDVRALELVRQ